MDYVTLCQICRNPDCKKGSKVFNSFSMSFKTLCPPFCMLHLKQALKDKKEKVEQLVNQLTSLVFEE